MDHESHIDISDPLMLAICLEDQRMAVVQLSLGGPSNMGGMNTPSVMNLHRQSREMRCMQSVCHMGQNQMSPKLSLSWLWRVSCGMEPWSASIRRMQLKLSVTI